MKTLINLIRRAIAKNRICSLELRLSDETSLMHLALTRDEFTAVYLARAATQKDLAAARAHYNSLLPVGQRKTWGIA